MTRNPILKVLSTFKKHGVRNLLIGGQATIIYGAAQFSRDSDFIVLCDSQNIIKLKKALKSLKAQNIYVPPLKKEFLDKGHACHFRCNLSSVKNLRIDILSKMKGCDSFEELWKRRFIVRPASAGAIDVIGLYDLVQSKKTQRDKDWFMINKLVENDMLTTKRPTAEKIKWWLCECRNPEKLIELASKNKKILKECAQKRPLLRYTIKKDVSRLMKLLKREEILERKKDIEYWQPLKKELEMLRHTVKG